MTVIPAQVAGVQRIVVVSPHPAKETLAAAALLGITEFYRVGGAQAIAALAYGTASLPRVDKIVGPGNAWVTAAKKLVAFDCAIDMLAGPTEIVVTSETGDPALIAADLVAQAEHDPDAMAILITTRVDLARAVMAEVKTRARRQQDRRAGAGEARTGRRCALRGGGSRTDQSDRSGTSHRRQRSRSGVGSSCRIGVRWAMVGAAAGRLHVRAQSHPAHRRPGAGARRPERAGFSEGHHSAGVFRRKACGNWGPRPFAWRMRRDWRVTRKRSEYEAHMTEIKMQSPQPSSTVRRMKEYHPPLGDRSGLRLDFNENTIACSPRVLDALGAISRGDLTRYPEREPVERRVARAPRAAAVSGAADERRGRGDSCPVPDVPGCRHRDAAAGAHLFHV